MRLEHSIFVIQENWRTEIQKSYIYIFYDDIYFTIQIHLLLHFYLEQVLLCIYVCSSCSNRFQTYIAVIFSGVFITLERNSALFLLPLIKLFLSFVVRRHFVFIIELSFCSYNLLLVEWESVSVVAPCFHCFLCRCIYCAFYFVLHNSVAS